MTDLQDALDWVDSFPEPTNKMTVLANAARLVANPNYEAATTAMGEALSRLVVMPGASKLIPVVEATIEAALTPPGDTDTHA